MGAEIISLRARRKPEFAPVTRGADRVRGHLGASDADQTDAIEVWGTRIGRALGLVVFVALVGWLVLSFLGKI